MNWMPWSVIITLYVLAIVLAVLAFSTLPRDCTTVSGPEGNVVMEVCTTK